MFRSLWCALRSVLVVLGREFQLLVVSGQNGRALHFQIECGEAFLPLARGRSDLEILTEPRELDFDLNGMLPRTMAGK